MVKSRRTETQNKCCVTQRNLNDKKTKINHKRKGDEQGITHIKHEWVWHIQNVNLFFFALDWFVLRLTVYYL